MPSTTEGSISRTGAVGRQRFVYAWVAAAALLVRVSFVILQIEFAVFDIAFDATDTGLYRSLTESLRSGEGFAVRGEHTAYVTPGYPLFLAALYVVSPSTLFIALVQSLLGAATAVLLAALAFRLGGIRAAWAAGLAAALYPHLVFWTGYVLTETLYVFAVVAAAYLTVRAVETDSRWVAAGAGLTWGGAFLVRPIMLGLALVVAFAGALSPRFRSSALVGLGALLLVVGAWTARNVITMESFIVTSAESGYVLWQGNSPDATGGTRGYVDHLDFETLDLDDDIGEVERDRIYMREALEWMRENPGRVAALAPKKLWNMWRPAYEGASPINLAVTLVTYPLLLIGGLAGLWVARRKGILGWLLIAFFLYHLLVHGLVTGMIRFRLPVEAMLIPGFGSTIAALFEKSSS